MKIRNSFVSNSSSSSFIIYQKDTGKSKEELKQDALEKAIKWFGNDFIEDAYIPQCLQFRKSNEMLFNIIEIEYGAEKSVENLFNMMNIDNKFRMKWGE